MSAGGVVFSEVARRFGRLKPVRRSAFALVVLSAVLVATLACFSGLKLSSTQTAQRELGPFEHRVKTTAPVGDLFTDRQVSELDSSLAGLTGVEKFDLEISTSRLVPDTFIQQATTGEILIVNYFEQPRPVTGAVDRWNIELLSGRLPAKPSEAVLSSALYEQLGKPDKINIFGTMMPLEVTGVVKPVFSTSALNIYAGWGSWQRLPGELLKERNLGIESSFLTVYWSGSASAHDVATQVCAVLGDDCDPGEVSQEDSYIADIIHSAGFKVEKNAVTIIGITVLMSALASFVVVNVLRNRMFSIVSKLSSVGVRRIPVFVSLVTTLTTVLVVGILGGALLGIGLAMGIKHFVLAGMVSQPLSPLSTAGLWRIVVIQVLVVVICVPLYSWLRLRTTTSKKVVRSRHTAGVLVVLRWLIGAALVFAAFQSASYALENGDEGTYRFVICFTLGFAMVTPEVISVIMTALPTRRSVLLAAKRIIKADLPRFAFVMAVMMIGIGIPTAIASRAMSIDITMAKSVEAEVPEGQVWVNVGELPSPEASADLIQLLHTHAPSQDSSAWIYTGSISSSSDVSSGGASISATSGIIIIKDTASARLIFKQFWNQELETAFIQGAFITYPFGPDSLTLDDPTTGASRQITPDQVYRLPTNQYDHLLKTGAISLAQAKQLGISDLRPSRAVYYHLTDQHLSNLYQLLASNGFSGKLIKPHTPVEPFTLSAEYWILLASNAFVVLAIVWLVMRGQAKHLEEYSVRLNAVGLNRAWSARLLMVMTVFISLTGTLLGVILGLATAKTIINVVNSLDSQSFFSLQIPTSYLAILIFAVLISSMIGGLLSLTRLTPQKRLEH